MSSALLKIALFAALVLGCISLLFLAHARPGYFNNAAYLSGFIFLQVLIAAVGNFRRWFAVLLVLSFVFAGTDLPLGEGWTTARWLVLAVGTAVGFVIFMRSRKHHFGAFHLLALFCVLAAFVSAIISYYPSVAFLKALSLLLLFLYSASGGRVTILGREKNFYKGLLLGCEITVLVTAISYLVLHHETWGNPNSLGLVMGTATAPLLLWGVLISETRPLRWRRTFFLVLCLTLLIVSNSRAGMLSCAVALAAMCIALRQRKIMIQGLAGVLVVIAVTAIFAPSKLVQFTSQSTETLLYKGQRQAGILGSRRSPWQQTMDVIQAHPWFGSGFGTSPSGSETMKVQITSSTTETAREHGSSYLAILEWVGLLGVTPFYALLMFLLITVARVFAWMRRTGNKYHPVVPLAAVVLAGLVHAGFEDWLFAVGYYLCVFYWPLAFSFIDLAPPRLSETVAATPHWTLPRIGERVGAVAPTR